MATGTRSLPSDSPVPYFQPIERGHVSEGGLSDIDSQRAVLQGGAQMPPCCVNLNETVPTYPQVVLNTILLFQNQIDYPPILDWMIMILYLKLDMVEEH